MIAAVAVAALLVWLLCFPPAADTPTTDPEPTNSVTTTEPSDPTEEDDVYTSEILSFTGEVLEIDGESVLIKCIDSDRFDTVWANVSGLDITPQVGEEYVVYHEDMVMPSLPPRITAVKMEKK